MTNEKITMMSEQEKQQAIKGYFEGDFSIMGRIIAIIGLIVMCVGGFGFESIVTAIVGVIIAIIGLIMSFMKPKLSDEDMDNYISECLNQAVIKSLKKTSLDESELVGESLILTGPRIFQTAGATILSIKGKDNKLRFTPINTTILHLAQNQLITYQACLDLTTGKCLNETTDEYFYKDVVSVATKTESVSFENAKKETIQLDDAEEFVLTTSGGTYVKTILTSRKLIDMMGGGEIPETNAEKAIQAIRKMLREKKQN